MSENKKLVMGACAVAAAVIAWAFLMDHFAPDEARNRAAEVRALAWARRMHPDWKNPRALCSDRGTNCSVAGDGTQAEPLECVGDCTMKVGRR